MSQSKIIYTITDEAPMLATFSLLPTIDAAGTDAFYDAFYIGDNDDSDDGTV